MSWIVNSSGIGVSLQIGNDADDRGGNAPLLLSEQAHAPCMHRSKGCQIPYSGRELHQQDDHRLVRPWLGGRWLGTACGSSRSSPSITASFLAVHGVQGVHHRCLHCNARCIQQHSVHDSSCSPKVMCCCTHRNFLDALLPTFKQENPQLRIEEALRPGHHPYLHAEYRESSCHLQSARMQLLWVVLRHPFFTGNGRSRAVDIKNQPEEEILRQAVFLRSAAGRATHVKVAASCAQPACTDRALYCLKKSLPTCAACSKATLPLDMQVRERHVQPYVRSATGEIERASPSVQGLWRPMQNL